MEDQWIYIWLNHQKEGKYWIKLFCPYLNWAFLIAKRSQNLKKIYFDSVLRQNKCETFSNFSCLLETLYFNMFIMIYIFFLFLSFWRFYSIFFFTILGFLVEVMEVARTLVKRIQNLSLQSKISIWTSTITWKRLPKKLVKKRIQYVIKTDVNF